MGCIHLPSETPPSTLQSRPGRSQLRAWADPCEWGPCVRLLCPSQHECSLAPARPLPLCATVTLASAPWRPSLVTSGLSSPLCAASPLGRLCTPLLFPLQPGLWLFITAGWYEPGYLVLLSASMFCHCVTAVCQGIHKSTFFSSFFPPVTPHFAVFVEHVLSKSDR